MELHKEGLRSASGHAQFFGLCDSAKAKSLCHCNIRVGVVLESGNREVKVGASGLKLGRSVIGTGEGNVGAM